MRNRPIIWLLSCLLFLAGGLYFWQLNRQSPTTKNNVPPVATAPAVRPRPATTNQSIVSAANAPAFLTGQPSSAPAPKTNRFAYRLSNTPKTVGQLVHDDHAILLENALIDTRSPLNFSIPQHLRAAAEPGSYIVQAHGPVDDAFRAALTAAGGTIISYIPNNAYLVRLSADGASQLSGGGLAQAVSPYEPIYKFKSDLLKLAIEQQPLPPDARLKVIIFADARERMLAALRQGGAVVLGEAHSWFGLELTLQPGENWTALAQLPEMMVMELAHPRVAANDLSRVRVAVATGAVTTNNYLNLTGDGVLVSVNDTGVDPAHPDLTGRVLGNFASSLVDDNGHGTFVAGEIAGSGAVSDTVSNASGSINPGVVGQYRGKAPGARVFAQSLSLLSGPVSDVTLQETAALTNALISNNSWHFGNDNTYGIGAASYDAAVRDALPGVTGSQPLLVVFAAGNSGDGNDSGLSGKPESILSPGTAKNVITVGALELPRDITNEVVKISSTTTNKSTPWKGLTSSGSQVAAFSSRGNVGIGVEGDAGRFKPDLVAPGTFVVSTRSTTWDENAYYNPTNDHFTTFKDQVVVTNAFNNYSLFLPENAVGFTVRLFPNQDSPSPFPKLPIFVRRDDIPSPPATANFVRTNSVSVPPDGGGVGASVGQNWFYTIGNGTTQNVSFDLVADVITTNDLGNKLEVLSNLNNSISGTNALPPHNYRYESGTSMAAADVSGTLALMQQFFEQGLGVTNSPAMMKALLINGARSAGSLYDFEVQNAINYQGWGLLKLNNSLPSGITNAFSHSGDASMQLFDQSPARALATGQSQTRSLVINEAGRNLPLRVTLVWTDPPGNPVAGVKLVNDLDLVVTNLTTGEVFFGNDIPVNSTFTFPWETNSPPIVDAINNVENVYLAPSLGTNYSITVVGRRVNVNAVTAQTNNVVQDYALVIASGNGEVTNALTLLPEAPVNAVTEPYVTPVTNSFAGNPNIAGSILLGQHVGANTPLLGTTNGMTNQWHFYIVTNTTGFTNAAFITFLPPELALPRMAVRQDDAEYGATLDADIDLYVSQDPRLLTLDPAVIAAADQSRNRGGTEFVAYTNALPGAVYYVGVKSEDQMAAEYAFFGGFSLNPFSQKDEQGNVIVNGFPIPSVIPDGSPSRPGGVITLGLALQPVTVRRLIVTNSIYHENLGDLVSTLSHARKFTVLNNHRSAAPGEYTFVYEDNDEQSLQHPDGPGQLRDFVGDSGLGVWLLTTVDNAQSQTGSVTGLTLRLEPSLNSTNGSIFEIEPARFVYEVVDVPVGATNLQVCLTNLSLTPEPVELYLRREGFPTRTTFDYFKIINPPADCLTITPSDLPPLQPGRYYIGVFNSSGVAQTIRLTIALGLDPNGVVPIGWGSGGNEPLRDDVVTDSTITVTNDARIQQVEVGLRIDHPRVSDLAVTLISPRGTRVLLAQNRGGTSTEGFGSTISVTNVIPVSTNGGFSAVTNVIDTGATAGSLTIDYDFFDVPDQMTVYYQGVPLRDSLMISGAGRFTVPYGPGLSTLVTIIMNEFGNPSTNTAWNYTVSSINNNYSYLYFTENTNLTTTPIKFAAPPLTPLPPGPVVPISDFEPPQAPGDFVTSAIVDGWSVLTTNPVTVIAGAPPVTVGRQSLALRTAQILRTVPTIPGRSYRLNFDYRKAGNLDGIVSWWLGQNNANDNVDGNIGALVGNTTYGVGKVGPAFAFDGDRDGVNVGAASNLQLQDFTIETWVKRSSSTVISLDQPGPGAVIFGYGLGGYNFSMFDNGNLFLGKVGISFTSVSSGITDLNWHHVAVTKSGSTVVIYVDGVSYLAPAYNPGFVFTSQAAIGATPQSTGSRNSFYGSIDEPAIFNRPLSAAEIQQIYSAGAAGKCGMITPPAVCGTALGAQIFVPGQVTNSFLGTTNWQPGGLIFTANSNLTTIGLSPISGDSGVLVDSFTLTEASGPRYVLAEESLEILKGENARGDWTIELWDSRTGATTLASLVSWQMQFIFQTNTAIARPLQPGVPVTTTIPPGQIAYYIVDVPAVARFATNILYNATPGPLGFYFNQTIRPAFGATNPAPFPDVVFAANANNWTEVLSTTNTAPPTSTKATLLPGQRYYLALENKNAFTVSYTVLVDFDLAAIPPFVTLTNGVPYCAFNAGPGISLDYYRYQVSSNAVRAQLEINNPSGDMTLLLRRGLPPTFSVFDYFSANVFTNDEVITVFDFSQPVPLAPGDWYMAAANISGGPVSYCVSATEWAVYGTNIVITNAYATSNSFCLTWTSLPGLHYYVEGLTNLTSTNWVAVSPTVTAVDYSTTHCVPLPSPFSFFRVRAGIAINPYFPPPVISSIRQVYNGILLTWGGPTNEQYQVEWTPFLVPTTWTPFLIPPAVTSTTGLFQFLDDGSQTGGFDPTRFYRLLQLP